MFLGREKELKDLEALYAEEGFGFVVVQGSRGSGKTTLIEKFCGGKNAIYFSPASQNNRANLRQFSQLILSHYKDEAHPAFQFWDNAFSYIAAHQKGRRVILVLDDADKLAGRDVVFASVLAKAVNEVMEMSGIFLIVACADDSFIANAKLVAKVSRTISIAPFLTEKNIEALKTEAVRQTKIQQAKFFRVPADSTVISEGSMNDDIYKIISGRAVCYVNYGKPDEYILGSLKEGKTFGEYSVLTGEAGIYTVVAFSDMLLLRISRSEFENFITLNAGNSTEIMKNMAGMLKVMRYGLKMLGEEMQEQN